VTNHLLDNIVWHSLAGPHAKCASGTNEARRYAPGFPAGKGFADAERPDFAGLAPYCEPGEHLHCVGWSGPAPSGWRIHVDKAGHRMVWDAALPAVDDTFAAVRLGPEHVPQMLELVAVTQPGPFGARIGELGEYHGMFEGPRLVAMAGDRFEAGALGIVVIPWTVNEPSMVAKLQDMGLDGIISDRPDLVQIEIKKRR